MSETNRRSFLKSTGAAAGGSAILALADSEPAPAAENNPANDKLVLALIGCGGRGLAVAKSFAGQPDIAVAYVCDPDSTRAGKAARAIEGVSGKAPRIVSDLRQILDDQSVDAVQIATPDHWHAPATLLALAADKHVYVEKPCSHNIREGRLMIEAARRQKKVVQTGTQSRSGPHVIKAIELLREGAIGEVLVSKAWNSQRRKNIGHAAPSIPPPDFDYDLWVGPAPMVPFQPNRHHYTWHWWCDFGTGDFGNDGVHDVDLARWGLGVETHPSHVACLAGKYFFDDDQQFPDTQYAVFEYPGDRRVGQRKQLIFEMRTWSPYRQEGFENGNAFYGTEGMLLLGKNDAWQLFGPKNKLRDSMEYADREVPHQRNFVDCIRTGRLPNADVEIGHLSATLCHLGNIAARVGRSLTFDPQKEQIVGDEEANRLVNRTYREGHWATPRDK